jgi:hypothetical protein
LIISTCPGADAFRYTEGNPYAIFGDQARHLKSIGVIKLGNWLITGSAEMAIACGATMKNETERAGLMELVLDIINCSFDITSHRSKRPPFQIVLANTRWSSAQQAPPSRATATQTGQGCRVSAFWLTIAMVASLATVFGVRRTALATRFRPLGPQCLTLRDRTDVGLAEFSDIVGCDA